MNRFRLMVVAVAVLLGGAALAQSPAVSNRPPKAGEIGYRPADGEAVGLNPPSFIWLHEKEAQAYSIQWARTRTFQEAQSAEGFAWNTYTHHQPWPAGTYYWRYRYVTKKGEVSSWSAARSVVVPAGAAVLPMPTRAQQKQSVPAAHPRLFLRPEDLPRLRQAARGPLARTFAKIQADADKFIQAGPTPEPDQRGSARDKEDLEAVKHWWPNREQTDRACHEAETIAFTYLITQDPKYGQAARKWVLHLASWNPDGNTNFALNCEAGKVMLYRPWRAYDWAHDVFSPEDRKAIQAAASRRIADAWKSGEVAGGTGHLNSPYNSHGNRVWHKIGEAGVAFLGEIEPAETWLDYAVNKFFGCYPVWADDDGGWHEGVSYWGGYMGKAVWWLQVAQSALKLDGLKKPFFAQVGDYPLYVCPPGSPNSGFGDLSVRPMGSASFMDYHIRMRGASAAQSHAPYWRWWFEQWKMRPPGGILGFLYEANLPAAPAAKAPTDLPQSKVFRGIGVASLHTSLLEAGQDVHLLLKSSPFGTQSHGHNAHNSFQLNAYGEPLLVACTYRDLHGSKFHTQYVWSTASQNALLVEGEGQVKHSSQPHGRIAAASLNDAWDYVAGEAADAYGGRLTRCRRHAVLVKKPAPFIVLCDDVAAKAPCTVQFLLHALQPFELDEKAGRATAQRKEAGVEAAFLASGPVAFRQWDGFNPPPRKDFPTHFHLEASTKEKAPDLRLVTVLVPYRGKNRPAWSASRSETPDAVVVTVSIAGTRTVVRIPRTDAGAAGVETQR